jgi:hypothetical protein
MPVLHTGHTFWFDYWSIVIMMAKEPWQLKMIPTKLVVLIKSDKMKKEYLDYSHRIGHSGHFSSVSSVSQRETVTTNFWNFVHLRDAQARRLRPFIWKSVENCVFYSQNTVKLVGVGFSSTKLGPPDPFWLCYGYQRPLLSLYTMCATFLLDPMWFWIRLTFYMTLKPIVLVEFRTRIRRTISFLEW